MNELANEQGFVTLIGTPSTSITSNSASVIVIAPDSQACSVDYSPEDPTVIADFMRVNDSGTLPLRVGNLSRLEADQTYYYRISCAVYQPTGVFLTLK